MTKIALIGAVGVPAQYGGFETLAENLCRYHAERLDHHEVEFTVYCSSKAYNVRPNTFLNSALRYIPIRANGFQSIIYDAWSLCDAVLRKSDAILLLGVSGAIILPILRLVSNAHIITNIDGIEWRREKWKGWARYFLRFSERVAVRYSHVVIADNQGIGDYVREAYGVPVEIIAYGGEHSLVSSPVSEPEIRLPSHYALALCRIEPENNVEKILLAFSKLPDRSLVFVGNWNNSPYGRRLRRCFASFSNLILLDAVYDPSKLFAIRSQASIYVHGHSAGGTNPSLVEMMHFGIPIVAFNCNFNRYTTEDRASYFTNVDDLTDKIDDLFAETSHERGVVMKEIAKSRYTWNVIGDAYFEVLGILGPL